jgi:ATP-binding cassette, subfamily F, member 3
VISLIAGFRFPDVDKISPPLLQLSGVDFGYIPEKQILKNVYIDIGLDSRIAVVGANGAGKLYNVLDSWSEPIR